MPGVLIGGRRLRLEELSSTWHSVAPEVRFEDDFFLISAESFVREGGCERILCISLSLLL